MAISCCGGGQLCISNEGEIYPCYLYLSLVKYGKREKLCCGDIWKGITSPEIIRKFQGVNPDMSCFIWNYIVNNNTSKPVQIYSKLYKHWLDASKYVNNILIKKNYEKNKH